MSTSRISLAEKIALAWNEQGIKYAVVHGLHEYPSSIGRDLDIIIQPESVSCAVELAKAIARKEGYEESFIRWSYWGLYQLVLINKIQRVSLPIDLLCTRSVWQSKWITFVDDKLLNNFFENSAQNGPFNVSIEGSFYKVCVRPLICGDISRFGNEVSMPVLVPPEVDQTRLRQVIGKLGEELIALPNRSELEKKFPSAAKKIQLSWLSQNKLGALISLVRTVERRLKTYFGMRAELLVLRTGHREDVVEVLKNLTQDFKSVFIELRVVEEPPSAFDMLFGRLVRWRKPPISEFVLYAVVEGVSNGSQIKRNTYLSQNTLSIDLESNVDIIALNHQLFDAVLRFFAKKYSHKERLFKYVE